MRSTTPVPNCAGCAVEAEGGAMLAKPLLSHILDNDALTRGLGDPEALLLVGWLVEQAEQYADTEETTAALETLVKKLCRRGRAIGRFVVLWCHEEERGAATQLAASERFHWPLPTTTAIDPYELMQDILTREEASSK